MVVFILNIAVTTNSPLTVTCPQVMSPSKREYQRVMAENLGTDLSNTRYGLAGDGFRWGIYD